MDYKEMSKIIEKPWIDVDGVRPECKTAQLLLNLFATSFATCPVSPISGTR